MSSSEEDIAVVDAKKQGKKVSFDGKEYRILNKLIVGLGKLIDKPEPVPQPRSDSPLWNTVTARRGRRTTTQKAVSYKEVNKVDSDDDSDEEVRISATICLLLDGR
jgi:predicted ThiF/HesA family dinucleotide-utilizing enzyme